MLNGIVDIVERSDLASRTLFLSLEPIPDEERRTEEELDAEFSEAWPRILGALLDAVATGLRLFPHTVLTELPRMADFAQWVTACETALWPAGTFLAAYKQNRKIGIAQLLDTDLVADAVRDLMRRVREWRGTASELLEVLTDIVGERAASSRAWPRAPQELSKRLMRASTFIRSTGIGVSQDRVGKDRTRIIRILVLTEEPSRPAADVLPPDVAGPPARALRNQSN
jgi:hypothetical protein